MHRKFWTAFFSLVVVLCLAFGFVGCDGPAGEGGGGGGTKLATPTNLRIEQTALLWDAVENATGYVVKADGHESSVNGTSFSLAQLTEGKTYKLQVKATGGTGYEDSDWSAEISYTPATAPAGGHVIVSAEGFIVDGTTLYIKVSNATETFDFNDKITVRDGATWVLSNDALGESSIVTKTISLSEPGDKTVYIIVTGDDGYTSYTVTVRRRPVYNVTYVLGSGEDIVKKIEEDGFAAELTEDEIPDREGFEFKGYDYDFSQPITGDTTVKLKWDSGLHYIDENGETVPVENDYEILSAAADRTLTGWYILRGQVSGNFTLTVSGEAHIILDDGCFWTVTGNIIVPESSVLNIYAVSSGSETGSLTVGGNIGGKDGVDGENGEGEQFGPDGEDGTAGTDGTDGQDAGTIIINGGFIAAQAVGGGKGGRGGNGGVGSWGASGATASNGVGLTGGSGGDGGKGGSGGSVECIVINGGNVDTGRIGGGFGGSGGDGGRGGLGGTGKHGIQGNTKSGGRGGIGGKGGSGGDGGTGGSIG